MRIWLDTEFIEDGRTIDLVSLGAVREDGGEFYAECSDFNPSKASPWVVENVLSQLTWPENDRLPAREIGLAFLGFAGPGPEFWGYYADYDWVVVCQMYGTMMDLPKGWPMYCRDLKQLADDLGSPMLPTQHEGEHNALEDAKWNRLAWEWLQTRDRQPTTKEE